MNNKEFLNFSGIFYDRKRWTTFLIAALGGILLAGCQDSLTEQPESSAVAAPEKPVEERETDSKSETEKSEPPARAQSASSSQGIAFEHGTFQETLDKAKEENKLVFMDCHAVWCGPCKILASKVFPQKEVGDVFNAEFVSIKMDMEKGEGPALATQFEIRSLPTLLFIDPTSGDVLRKVVGGIDAQGLLVEAANALDPSKQLATLHDKFEDGERSQAFLCDYIKALSSVQELDEMAEIGKSFLESTSITDLCNGNAVTILKQSRALEYNSKSFKAIVANKDKFLAAESVTADDYNGLLEGCIRRHLFRHVDKTVVELEQAFKEVAQYLPPQKAEEIRLQPLEACYYQNEKYEEWVDYITDGDRAEQLIASTINTPKWDRTLETLLNTALRVIQMPEFDNNVEVLAKATKLCDLVKQADPDFFTTYHALTVLHMKRGHKAQAQENLDLYIVKGKAEGYEDIEENPFTKRWVAGIEAMEE